MVWPASHLSFYLFATVYGLSYLMTCFTCVASRYRFFAIQLTWIGGRNLATIIADIIVTLHDLHTCMLAVDESQASCPEYHSNFTCEDTFCMTLSRLSHSHEIHLC